MREVTIKGIRQGLMLVLPDDQDWPTVVEQLKGKLAAASGLIAGAKAQVDLGDRPVDESTLLGLVEYLNRSYQIELIGLMGARPEARHAAETLGIPLVLPAPPTPAANEPAFDIRQVVPAAQPANPANNALYLRQTVRSGQSIRHDGTIVICGDVNAGAEVIATGDIVVFGTLRGVAHAGAAGDEDAHIMAINLRPTQIRIAGYIARSPDAAAPPLSKYPEVARVSDSEIHIIPLRDMS